MPLYEVQITRIGYGVSTIKVSAETPNDATVKAEDEAGDHQYTEHHSEYQIGAVRLIPPPPESELNAKQLADSYGEPTSWGAHPDYPRVDWQHEVSEGGTQIGYWEWVVNCLQYEADEEGKVTV